MAPSDTSKMAFIETNTLGFKLSFFFYTSNNNNKPIYFTFMICDIIKNHQL